MGGAYAALTFLLGSCFPRGQASKMPWFIGCCFFKVGLVNWDCVGLTRLVLMIKMHCVLNMGVYAGVITAGTLGHLDMQLAKCLCLVCRL